MPTRQSHAPIKIFTVDDSPILQERLHTVLQDLKAIQIAGHASNIASALKAIEKILPEVVILDIHLKNDAPSANGLDLLFILRKSYPKMIIMMLTNLATPQYMTRCMELGADYFYDKTNDFEKIPETLKTMIKSK